MLLAYWLCKVIADVAFPEPPLLTTAIGEFRDKPVEEIIQEIFDEFEDHEIPEEITRLAKP